MQKQIEPGREMCFNNKKDFQEVILWPIYATGKNV